jgi:hypothetical protein
MRLDLQIPKSLLAPLQESQRDLETAALEGLALEGYRRGVLSLAQVRELLGLPSLEPMPVVAWPTRLDSLLCQRVSPSGIGLAPPTFV